MTKRTEEFKVDGEELLKKVKALVTECTILVEREDKDN